MRRSASPTLPLPPLKPEHPGNLAAEWREVHLFSCFLTLFSADIGGFSLFAPGGSFYTLPIKITLPAAPSSHRRPERRYNLL